jgi:hypothetical protein
MTDKKKHDYDKPQSFSVLDDDLDDIAGGRTGPRGPCANGDAVSGGSCSIGGSAQGECGAGLVTSFCAEGGSAGETCATGRIR